jgi:hypothetical protein
VVGNLSPRDHDLRRMMLFPLRRRTPSDYPFLFCYSYCRTIHIMTEPSPSGEQWAAALPKTCCEVLECRMEDPARGTR